MVRSLFMKNLLTLVLFSFALSAWGQVTLTGSSYTETFDGIASGLPTGWTVRTGATVSAIGIASTFTNAATTWGSATGNFRNCASGDGMVSTASGTDQSNSTDRALSVRQTGSFGDPGAAFILQLTNTTGFQTFQAQFKLQSLDAGSTRTTTWTLDYGVGATPTSFTPLSSGTTGGGSFSNNTINVVLPVGIENQNTPVWIRIVTLSVSTGSNSRTTTGIDDFNLTYSAINPSVPNITINTSSLSDFLTNIGTPSSTQSYNLNGSNLTNDIVVNSLNTNVEISTSAFGPFGNSLTLAQLGGNVASTPIHVRFTGANAGSFSNLIVENTSTGAITRNVNISGNVIDPNAPVTIASARAQAVNSIATVRGRVTAQFGGLVYVQDATGGIPVFSSDFATAVAVGDSVLVTGTRQDFSAQKQLSGSVSFTKYNVPPFVPAPLVITPAQFSANEGRLVTVQNERIRPDYIDTGSPIYVFDTTFVFVSDNNYQLQGEATTNQVRISMFSNIPGSFVPDGTFDLTGVVGVFNTTFQLFPRSRTDFSPALTPYINTAGSNIPADSTLDVVSWNIEWLGSTADGPSDEIRQMNNSIRAMRQIAADIYVLQEISTTGSFNQLRDSLSINGYWGTCSPYASNLDNGMMGQGHPMPVLTQQPTGNAQRVCMLYKVSVVTPVREQPLLRLTTTEALTNYPYPSGVDNFWASGRYPYLWIVNASIGGTTKQFHVVGVHAKANTSPIQTSYDRRKVDVDILRDTLNTQYPNANIILLGDYNDDVDETVAGGVSSTNSTYKSLVDDLARFRITTYRNSDLNFRSYITRRNVIDHIAISNELFDNYIDGTGDILFPFTYISSYGSSTSDHLPVRARFRLRDCPTSHTFVEKMINNPVKFEVSSSIHSTARIQNTANIQYDSANTITLNPGFSTDAGAVFEAFIDGCAGSR